MIRTLLALALALAATARGQGQTSSIVYFYNGGAINAPFFDVDGTTRLAGPNFRAALYWGLPEMPLESWSPAGPPQDFQTGLNAGFWMPANRTLPTPTLLERVGLQVKFWESAYGATFEEAQARGGRTGVSVAIVVVLSAPPFVTLMTGLQSATLMLPTITLSRGVPGLFTDPFTVGSGPQLTNLCDARVGLNRWFRIASPYPGETLVTTTGSSIDTVMSAFTGSIISPSTLTLITCNDDSATNTTASEVRFTVEANKLYLLCVAGKNGASGTIRLNHTLLTTLRIRRMNQGHVELSWPADATNFIAEATSQFPADWRSITNTPVTVGSRSVVQRDCGEQHEVYRLRLRN